MTEFSTELKNRLSEGAYPNTVLLKLGFCLQVTCFPFLFIGGAGFAFMLLNDVTSYEIGQLLRVLASSYMSGVYLLIMVLGVILYAVGATIKKADT